jgi:hypothetical protein
LTIYLLYVIFGPSVNRQTGFLLPCSAVKGGATTAEGAVLCAQTEVNVTVDQARAWFLSLRDHPERYRFATHDGVTFVAGDFGQAGARFQTRERFFANVFARCTWTLRFQVAEVAETAFRFCLLKPAWAGVWGAFILNELGAASVSLRLEIGAATRLGKWLLRWQPVRTAVRRQIAGEVAHIKASMEALYGREGEGRDGKEGRSEIIALSGQSA